MSNPTLDQVITILATERPDMLSQFSHDELREQISNFVNALSASGRQRMAARDPLE